jgi:GNAT superfamily N-acetyltransferase
MAEDFVIRAAGEGDYQKVVGLIRELAEFEKLEGPNDEEAAQFLVDARAGRFELDVAEQGGELVGYALSFATYSTFRARRCLYLEDLFVQPNARGRGIGTAFMRHLAARAVERSCARFEWTVLEWNERAQVFYRSLGARVLREWWICRVDGAALQTLGKTKD